MDCRHYPVIAAPDGSRRTLRLALPGYRVGNGGSRTMLSAAGTCRFTDSVATQASWPPARRRATEPDCHGKEGVAGSSPAEGSFFFAERRTRRGVRSF